MRFCLKNRMIVFRCVTLLLVQCFGCVGVRDDLETAEFAALRGKTIETIRGRIGSLGKDRTFCCRVVDGWPVPDPKGLVSSIDYPCLGVVSPDGAMVHADVSLSHDSAFGEKLLGSILRCTTNDLAYVGALRKRKVRTAGLFWLCQDGSSFAGIAVITDEGVYFIYTNMHFVTNVEDGYMYDIFWASPPYYILRNPYWAVLLEMQGYCVGIRSRARKAYPEFQDRWAYADYCFDNLVTAFRIDIAPDEFP